MKRATDLTRRDLLRGAGVAMAGAAGIGRVFGNSAPTAPVAIARCRDFERGFEESLDTTLDQIGGIGSLVRGKTVALKLNLTGNPSRFPERPDLPYRNNPDTVLAVARRLARSGANRIRILESFFPAGHDLALWARYGLDVEAIDNVGCKVEWENTNTLGKGKKYERVKVPWGGYIFPAYDLNHSYVDCDVFVSMSKLKNHWIAGVTMSMKNSFGLTPCSLYGGDASPDRNENPTQERGKVCHNGAAKPATGVPEELDPASSRDSGFRVPRITVDLVGVRPIDLAIVDGIESIRGGEGAWNKGVQIIKPGVLLVGRNPVTTDTVCAAVMGYDPRARRGVKPFVRGDNSLLLAEKAGIGTAELSRIEVAGLSVEEARYDYGPGPIGKTISLPVA